MRLFVAASGANYLGPPLLRGPDQFRTDPEPERANLELERASPEPEDPPKDTGAQSEYWRAGWEAGKKKRKQASLKRLLGVTGCVRPSQKCQV